MPPPPPPPAPQAGRGAQLTIAETIDTFRPAKIFKPDATHKHVTSLDFDDTGELCVTASTDESLTIYNCKEAKTVNQCISKKYGAHLGRFTHHAQSVLYASTKVNDDIRYLSTHDNSFLRYFSGHTGQVTSLSLSPANDTFLSSSLDDTVRLWDIRAQHATGILNLKSPYFTAYDPAATVIAIASTITSNVLLYDSRYWKEAPFATFDLLPHERKHSPLRVSTGWTGLEFSNDGKSMLVSTSGHGHFVLDAFNGELKAFLFRRFPANRGSPDTGFNDPYEQLDERRQKFPSQGDACFSPDGRFVLAGMGNTGLSVWDLEAHPDAEQRLGPTYELESKGRASVVGFNPRWNMFATGDRECVFWIPDEALLESKMAID